MAKFLVSTLTILVILISGIAQASIFEPVFWDDKYFIDVSELKPGMKGYGKTVIDGTKIEKIDCEILELMPNSGFDQNTYIICHVSGDLIDRTNGISGGMSGSPVYIDNRLAGAMSGAYYFTDSRTIMVTPIKHMLGVFNTQDPRFNPFKPAPPFEKFDTVNINWQPTRYYTDQLASAQNKTKYFASNNLNIGSSSFSQVALAPNKTQAKLASIANPNTAVFTIIISARS